MRDPIIVHMCESDFSDQCSRSMTFWCGSGSRSGTLFLTIDIAVQELIQLKSDLEQVIALTQELITTTASSSALQEVGLSILGNSSTYTRGCAYNLSGGNIPTFCTSMNAYHTTVFKQSCFIKSNDLYIFQKIGAEISQITNCGSDSFLFTTDLMKFVKKHGCRRSF
jgi:hypothetical protein